MVFSLDALKDAGHQLKAILYLYKYMYTCIFLYIPVHTYIYMYSKEFHVKVPGTGENLQATELNHWLYSDPQHFLPGKGT